MSFLEVISLIYHGIVAFFVRKIIFCNLFCVDSLVHFSVLVKLLANSACAAFKQGMAEGFVAGVTRKSHHSGWNVESLDIFVYNSSKEKSYCIFYIRCCMISYDFGAL